jgi:hypothetical protein
LNRIPRRLRGVIIGLVIATLPMAVVATDVFTDVPTEHQFHDVINNIAGAGITAGDPSGSNTYQPQKEVNRQQMAAFLNRGLGRVAYSGNGTSTALATDSDLGSVTITTGGVSAGTNFVKADASFTLTCGEVGGCSIVVSISDGTTNSSRAAAFTLADGESESASLTWVVAAETATDVTLTLSADSGGAVATGAGELSAEYVPFGPDGGNALDPTP